MKNTKGGVLSIFQGRATTPPAKTPLKLQECDAETLFWLVANSEWEKLDAALRDHWSRNAPIVFAPKDDLMDLAINEEDLAQYLLNPLMSLLAGRESQKAIDFAALVDESGINVHARQPGQICGRVFKSGELTYSCRDCANDPTCVMCYECFSHSEHKTHKYKMHASGGSGYCDCGDPEAWKSDPYCSLHKPIGAAEETAKEERVSVSLPEAMQERLRGLIKLLLGYSIQLTCWSDYDELPPGIQSLEGLAAPYQTILFNDEHHTYDQVIRALKRAIQCSQDNAMLLATVVDREGRSVVRKGLKEDCEKVKKVIETHTKDTIRGALRVEVTDSSLAANQLFALRLISWLTNAAQEFPPLINVIGEILLNEPVAISNSPEAESASLVTQIMNCDISLWKSARTTCHELMMGTILMDFEMKKMFAKLFTRIYPRLMEQFVKDDHEHSLSIVALTVQIYTVPTVARMLIAEERGLALVLKPLLDELQKYYDNDQEFYSFLNNSYPATVRRALFILNDIKYLLNSPPTPLEWTEDLREGFRDGCDLVLQLLKNIQGMDAQARQTGNHMEWESEWETAFNIQLRLQTIVTMLQAWALTDKEVFTSLFRACISMERSDQKGYETEVAKIGQHSAVCPVFDVGKEKVSIHVPLTRLLAGLFLGLNDFNMEVEDWVPQRLIEQGLRVMVMGAQIYAGMWRRNGYSVLNQVHNYMSPLCRTEMFDKDILMLQVGAALVDPNKLLVQIMHKFGLVNWARDEYEAEAPEDELSKQISALIESLLQLIIYITGERYVQGLGEGVSYDDMVRREVVHILCRGPLPFSKIEKKIPDYPLYDNIHLEEVIRTVANFKQPTGGSAGVFELKSELRSEFSPYFYHFSRTEMSEAEQHLKEKDKMPMSNSNPPILPQFMPFFADIPVMLGSDVLFHIMTVCLERCASKSRFACEGHLHRILYLIGMALNEEERAGGKLPEFSLKCLTWKRDPEKKSVLELLEALVGQPEALISAAFLTLTVKRLRKAIQAHQSLPEYPSSSLDPGGSGVAPVDEQEQKQKRRVEAEQRRKKAMDQMAKLQRGFIQQNKTMFEESSAVGPEDDEDVEQFRLVEGSGFPVCLGPHKSELEPWGGHRKVTCILCQETEEIGVGERGMVFAAFVQQSTLFSKAEKRVIERPDSYDPLFMPENLFLCVHASTCGHTMHAECWQTFFNAVQAKENRRPNRWPRLSLIDVDQGQYLCPLCKRISNTAMPALPPLSSLHLDAPVSPTSSVDTTEVSLPFENWVSTLAEMVSSNAAKMRTSRLGPNRKRSRSVASDHGPTASGAKEAVTPGRRNRNLSFSSPSSSAAAGAAQTPPPPPPPPLPLSVAASASAEEQENPDEDGESNEMELGEVSTEEEEEETDEDQELANQVASLYPVPHFLLQRGAAAMLEQFQRLFRRMSSTSERVPIGKVNLDMVKTFALTLYRIGLGVHPDEENSRVPIMSWQAAAYSLRCMAGVLSLEQKPLFGAFSARQHDCLHSLTRYTACAQFASRPEILRKHCLRLLSPFLLEGEKLAFFPAVFQLDIFTCFVEACMSVGSLFVDEPGKWAVPTGGLNDYYLLQLMLSAYFAQTLFTLPKKLAAAESIEAPEVLEKALEVVGRQRKDVDAVAAHVKNAMTMFLQPTALLCHALTQIPPPEGLKDPSIEQFPLLCRYLGLPDTLDGLLSFAFLESAWTRWMGHERVEKLRERSSLVPVPVAINRLISLPHDFGQLIHSASNFSCPSLNRDESRTPALCLVCGDLLCSQSYCCQRTLGKEQVGACNYHAHSCTAGVGIFLRMRDSQIVLLTKGKGWFLPAPYVDEFGETDSGFRRGNPLFFNEELFRRIEKIWLHQTVPEEVSNHLEMDMRVLAMDWVHL